MLPFPVQFPNVNRRILKADFVELVSKAAHIDLPGLMNLEVGLSSSVYVQ